MSVLGRGQWRWKAAVVAGIVGVGVTLAACSSSPSTSSSSSTTTTSPSSSSGSSSTTSSGATGSGATVQTASVGKYGTILVTSSGMTLYELDSTTSAVCSGSCLSIWPPLSTTGTPQAGTGVQASLLGTTTDSNGSTQVTYDGHPLFTYSGDSAAGQANGEGISSFGGTWDVVDPAGKAVTSSE